MNTIIVRTDNKEIVVQELNDCIFRRCNLMIYAQYLMKIQVHLSKLECRGKIYVSN